MRSSHMSAQAFALKVCPIACVLSVGLLVGACATSRGTYDHQSNVGVPSNQVAVATPPKVEIEADGLPAQLPPRRRRAREADDPSEPFSPNYGPQPTPYGPVGPVREPARQAARDDGWQPALRKSAEADGARRLSPAEADAVVARAIMAHERRYP